MYRVLYFVVRRLIALILGVTVIVPGATFSFDSPSQQKTLDVTVMSFNVYIAGVGVSSPESRGALVAQTIKNEAPDSFGLQEADIKWINRVSSALPEYAYVGVGRDDGAEKGEFSPVFYLKNKYDLIDSGTFWFSPTPEKPSRGWDAMCKRVCTFAVLRDKTTGFTYAHFNVHLDNAGSVARSKSADILLEKISALGLEVPKVITGDFNCKEGSAPYEKLLSGGFVDSKYSAEETMSLGTWHNFGTNKVDGKSPIDFIFVSAGMAQVKSYRVVTEKIDGAYPSDHYPVVSKMTLCSEKLPEKLRVMSFNVLCWGDDYNMFERIGAVSETICSASPDAFGVQEATEYWMLILNSEFEGEYASVGVGRDDGKNKGEFSAIFYRTDKFNLLDSGTFWLSQTPDVPSFGWEAKYKRVCTWALLESKLTGERFAFVNTHLDYVAGDTVLNQVKMVTEKANSFDVPVVITGDFNSAPNSAVYAHVLSQGYADSRAAALVSDPAGTYNGLIYDRPAETLDYIFTKGFGVNRFEVMDELCSNGKYASDHFAIYADVVLRGDSV